MGKIEAITLEKVYDLAHRIFDMGKMSVSAVGRLDKNGLENELHSMVKGAKNE
jgi:predicted Zn-dependent peptidase